MFKIQQFLRCFSKKTTDKLRSIMKTQAFVFEKGYSTKLPKYFNQTIVNNENEPKEILKWFLLIMPVGAFGLGCWQIQRRQWKLKLIQDMDEKTNGQPVNLPKNLSELSSYDYRAIKVKGHFLHDQEIVVGPRSLVENDATPTGSLMSDPKKNQGWLIITPFQLHDRKEKILINRGWVPRKMKNASLRPEGQIEEEVEITGIVRLAEKRPPFMPQNKPASGQWFYRDLDEMGQLSGSAPVWLDAKGKSEVPSGWPIPNQTRVTLRNEHMSYIVTWFGLSSATSYMWFRLFIQRLPLL